MKLEDIAKIYQGLTLSRIRTEDFEIEKAKVFSFDNEEKYIEIPKDLKAKSEIPFTRKNMVLLNLTSHRASIIEEEGLVIPSTFIVLEPINGLSVEYLEYYLNEDWDFKKNLEIIKQGSLIFSIPINSLKKIQVKLPPKEIQDKISGIRKIIKRNKRLQEEKEELIAGLLNYINQENKNDK